MALAPQPIIVALGDSRGGWLVGGYIDAKVNTKEILNRLNTGETIAIAASDALEFMRECHRHSLSSVAIKMVFVENRCVMRQVNIQHDELQSPSN